VSQSDEREKIFILKFAQFFVGGFFHVDERRKQWQTERDGNWMKNQLQSAIEIRERFGSWRYSLYYNFMTFLLLMISKICKLGSRCWHW
jgi:hypothetical protein